MYYRILQSKLTKQNNKKQNGIYKNVYLFLSNYALLKNQSKKMHELF